MPLLFRTFAANDSIMPLSLKLSPWLRYRLAQVATAGLAMWHKFTALPWTGANRLPDESGNGNTAALYTGRGLDFDGVNDVVTIGATGVTVKSVVFYANPDDTTEAFMQLQSTGAVRIEATAGTLSATGFTSPTLYVNGAAGSTVSAAAWQQIAVTSSTGVSASNVLLGQSNTSFYAGAMSNVKFFSVELTAAQIAELYANPEQALPTGVSAGDLVGWWPMSENNATFAIAIDGSPTNLGGSITGATYILSQESPLPQLGLKSNYMPMVFDGVNDIITNIESISGLSEFSISTWILPSEVSGNYHIISVSTGASNRTVILIQSSTIRCGVWNGSSTTGTTKSANIVAGKLYHVVYGYDGAAYFLYVNNVNQVGNTGPSNLVSTPSLGGGVYFFKGVIFSAAIYSKALSVSEIDSLFSGSLPNSVTNCEAYYQNTGISNSNWVNLIDATNNGSVGGSPTTFYSIEGVTAGKDITGFPISTLNNVSELLLRGNGYALATDAATLDITSAITLEAWVKPFTVASLQSIIGKNSAYTLEINASGKPQFSKWTSSSKGSATTTSTTLAVDVWKHIVATYDGTNCRIYIDGVLDTTTAMTGAIDATSTDCLIGALTSSTQLYSGYIDNARIYNRALSAAEVLGNYNTERSQFQ